LRFGEVAVDGNNAKAAAARRFNVDKFRQENLARTSGAPDSEE
jgi:hypothetical protein